MTENIDQRVNSAIKKVGDLKELNRFFQQQKTIAEERQKDITEIAQMLDCKNEVAVIKSEINTLIGYEDQTNQLKKKLDDERAEFTKSLKGVSATVESLTSEVVDLQKRLEIANSEIEKLKQQKPKIPDHSVTSWLEQFFEFISKYFPKG